MKRYPQRLLGTCCIPWKEDGTFYDEMFRRQAEFILKNGTRHLYIFGGAGEGYAVDEETFDLITGTFTEIMKDAGAVPMTGILSLSMQTIRNRLKRAYAMGVREFQIAFPSWGICTFPEVLRFFDLTCGAYPDCTFLHYNIRRAGRVISPEEYCFLQDRFPNLAATKNLTDSVAEITALCELSPELQHFFMERSFGTASLLGFEAGSIMAVATGNWAKAKEFYHACITGDTEAAGKYVRDIEDMTRELHRLVGDDGTVEGVFDKTFVKMAIPDYPLRLLPPYTGLDTGRYREYLEYVKKNHPGWYPAS